VVLFAVLERREEEKDSLAKSAKSAKEEQGRV
jgi:hypothetical protein